MKNTRIPLAIVKKKFKKEKLEIGIEQNIEIVFRVANVVCVKQGSEIRIAINRINRRGQ